MERTQNTPSFGRPVDKRRLARNLRIAGGTLLILGAMTSAGFYWLLPQPTVDNGDGSMIGYSRAATHQMETLYGKQGDLLQKLDDSVAKRSTQAILLFFAVAIVAGGCFFCSRVLEFEAEIPPEDTQNGKRTPEETHNRS